MYLADDNSTNRIPYSVRDEVKGKTSKLVRNDIGELLSTPYSALHASVTK